MALQPIEEGRRHRLSHEITYLANFGEIPSNHRGLDPIFLSSCSHVLWQTAPELSHLIF